MELTSTMNYHITHTTSQQHYHFIPTQAPQHHHALHTPPLRPLPHNIHKTATQIPVNASLDASLTSSSNGAQQHRIILSQAHPQNRHRIPTAFPQLSPPTRSWALNTILDTTPTQHVKSGQSLQEVGKNCELSIECPHLLQSKATHIMHSSHFKH